MPDGFSIEITDRAFFILFDDEIKDTKKLLKALGADAVEYSQGSFQRQGLHRRNEWRPRTVPNIAGIFADLNKGSVPPTRRLTPRPALKDTGALLKSITFKVISKDTVRIGTARKYGKIHQEGGTSVQERTVSPEIFRDRLKKYAVNVKDSLIEQQMNRVTSLRSTTQLSTDVPARPFLGYTVKRGEEIIRDHLKKQLGGV